MCDDLPSVGSKILQKQGKTNKMRDDLPSDWSKIFQNQANLPKIEDKMIAEAKKKKAKMIARKS